MPDDSVSTTLSSLMRHSRLEHGKAHRNIVAQDARGVAPREIDPAGNRGQMDDLADPLPPDEVADGRTVGQIEGLACSKNEIVLGERRNKLDECGTEHARRARYKQSRFRHVFTPQRISFRRTGGYQHTAGSKYHTPRRFGRGLARLGMNYHEAYTAIRDAALVKLTRRIAGNLLPRRRCQRRRCAAIRFPPTRQIRNGTWNPVRAPARPLWRTATQLCRPPVGGTAQRSGRRGFAGRATDLLQRALRRRCIRRSTWARLPSTHRSSVHGIPRISPNLSSRSKSGAVRSPNCPSLPASACRMSC